MSIVFVFTSFLGLDGKRIQVWFRNRRRKRKTPPRTLSNNLAETSNSPADSEGLIQPIAGDDEGEGEDEVLQMKRGRIKHAQDDDDDENDDVMDDDDSDEKEPGTKAGASISGNAPTHTRFKFQKYQLDVLERAYAEDGTTPRKSGEKLRALCDGTGMLLIEGDMIIMYRSRLQENTAVVQEQTEEGTYTFTTNWCQFSDIARSNYSSCTTSRMF